MPPSTLSTTPHILHTRTSITLPPSAQAKFGGQSNDEDRERESRRARERAERRLQTLTKETDWRVAKAYVSLAEGADEAAEYEIKRKEGEEVGKKTGRSSLEMMAVDRYLDDNEWEERERREGRGVNIPRFPYVNQDERQVSGGWIFWNKNKY